MKHPSFAAVLIGTGFGTGFSPFAPGTCGALLAMAIWGLFYAFFPSVTQLLWGLSALIVVFTVVGVWAANRLEACWGTDPSRVVVDEMVGTWIPLLAVPDSSSWYLYALGALALFRLFDIFKPLGIRRMENLKGGLGIMMDDILAGCYSLVLLLVVRCVWG